MLVTQKLSIDLANKAFSQYLYATQDDSNTRAVEITLTANKEPWVVPSGVIGAVSFRKPDKTTGLYDTLPDGVTAAVTFEQNKVTAILAPQVLTVAGDVEFAVVLYDPSLNRLGTFPVTIRVQRNPSAGAVVSNDYYNFSTLAELNDAIGDLADLSTTQKGSLVEAINELVANGQVIVVDPNLTIGGAAADAKAVGDRIGNLANLETTDKSSLVAAINEARKTGGGGGGTGLSTEAVNLLITILQNAVYTSNQTGNIAALANALRGGGSVVLTSISATYSGGDVEVGTEVSALTGIVVTAHYSDGSASVVTNYTMSGEIVEGSNTITVTYQGMTATFTVTGVAESGEAVAVALSAAAHASQSGVTGYYSDGGTTVYTPTNGGYVQLSTETFSADTVVTVAFNLTGTIGTRKAVAASFKDGYGYYAEEIGTLSSLAAPVTYTVKAGYQLLVSQIGANSQGTFTVTKEA